MKLDSSVSIVIGQVLNHKSYLAGSIQDYHAEELWKIEELDSIAIRGSASRVVSDPFSEQKSGDRRHERKIRREMVAKLIPPEQRR